MDIIKRYNSIESRDKRYVKDYGLLSFARNIGKDISSKYIQKLVNSDKKYATGEIKTASKRAIQKTAEAIKDLIGNKIADKITSSSKNYPKEFPSNEANNEIPKEYISPQERQQVINELRLI